MIDHGMDATRFLYANFANGHTVDSPDLYVPWEYENLLTALRASQYIWNDRKIRRNAGMLKFICQECGGGNHEGCTGLPNGDSSWCDCQHKGTTVAR